ncbi:Nudix family hydrolase [Halopseudomonas maritima]|uniref:Nudix family hydrolase n=1 Tax=Halopseudomonas maritima TaxID=2918528 RepID=UPI001EEA2989|nr:Nudix family hydrolase [Halopseudomonas maritima]UJJ32447.1 Nudix family hydrolase [Halopseudomonas maritima]
MRRIHVMAAVIRDTERRILIAKRPDDAHQGGLWEFPGGKLEPGESRLEALQRELREELGINVQQARPLIDLQHNYPDKHIRLDVWEVSEFTGTAHGAEGQPVQWVTEQQLPSYAFPAANQPIVAAARLPQRYLVTPDCTAAQLLQGIEHAIDAGISLIQLRQTQLRTQDYEALCKQVLQRFGAKATFMLKGDQPPPHPGAGWHLTSKQLRALADQPEPPRPLSTERWLSASCHDDEELQMAERLGVDFAVLSPLLPTASHSHAPPLGWERAQAMLSNCRLPVYLLGGLTPQDLATAHDSGAQGIAAIRGLWRLP